MQRFYLQIVEVQKVKNCPKATFKLPKTFFFPFINNISHKETDKKKKLVCSLISANHQIN